ncbi:hypothetical protein OAN45_04385 [Burkholderiales bacterium]|nr:hypothetical protein [Burkholderiales bacterium]
MSPFFASPFRLFGMEKGESLRTVRTFVGAVDGYEAPMGMPEVL